MNGDALKVRGRPVTDVRRGQLDLHAVCPRAIDTAVYLLDGLDAAEQEDFARHLVGCQQCRTEADELAPVARLLAVARRRRGRPGQP